MSIEEFYKSLEEFYIEAFCKDRLEIALKVRQLQAKITGLIPLKSRKIPKLSELTDAEIDEFVKECGETA
ncbi:MAG: hypothetical protein K2Q34_02330 [Alphaproteobacteria bacterium]|nr:hypothetical protein [Alphaproteobacteria bacterium]